MAVKFLLYVGLLTVLGFNAPADTLVQFRTAFGDLDVQLYTQDKPITVGNFIRYVQTGLYQDGFIHRCNPTFVIQGGGYYVANRNTANQYIDQIPTFGPISNEFGVGKIYSNVYGTIAMAKQGGNTNSATSQWFINLANNSFLDAPDTNDFFTVFGRVIRGTNVLNVFKTFSGTNTSTNVIRNLQAQLGPAFGELPALTSDLTYSDLLYVDVSLLNVQVQKFTNDTHQISWNSVVGRTNYVEFTTNLPPIWRSLVATNGTGNTLSVTDATVNLPRRLYRVRVDY
jgi:cyclophilin family peptidyl-prolyl cis-trans isomerase